MHSDTLLFSLWEALLLQQRKARFIALASQSQAQSHSSLSFAEGLILLIVEAEPGNNVRTIANALRLERSWVSRMVSSLVERGLVESSNSEVDQRSKSVAISRKGSNELARLMQARSEVVKEVFKALTPQEQTEVKDVLHKLADGLKAPQYISLESGHPIDVELARISWMTGVLGENFHDSGMNVTKCQLLYELSKKGASYSSASDLSLVFPADMSTVSRTMISFFEEGLIDRRPAEDDARRQLVRLNTKGTQRWQEIKTTACRQLDAALAAVAGETVQRLVELLGKAVSEIPGRVRPPSAERTIEVRTIAQGEREDLIKANAFAASLATGAGGGDNTLRTFGYYQYAKLQALMDIRLDEKGSYRYFSLAADQVSELDIMRFMKSALRISSRQGGTR